MTTLLKALFDHILSIPLHPNPAPPLPQQDEISNTLIKHIDRYHAQPEFLDEGIPFHMPAVFIEIPAIAWRDLGGKVQRGEATIRFHLLQYTLADTYQNPFGGSENQDIALGILNNLNTLHCHLHGFAFEDDTLTVSPLTRINTLADTRHNILTIDILEYTTLITDHSATLPPILQPLPPLLLIPKLQPLPPAHVDTRPQADTLGYTL